MNNYIVNVDAQDHSRNDEAIRKTQSFERFEDAYSYYNELVTLMNLTNAEYSDCVEMNHAAGGKGFDFKVELLVD